MLGYLPVRTQHLNGTFHTAEPSGSLRAFLRSSKNDSGEYQAIVNCTGPGQLIKADPLVRSLVAEWLAQSGPYEPARAKSTAAVDIYARLARRGHLWETTAAPEIRAQARALATHLIPLHRRVATWVR